MDDHYQNYRAILGPAWRMLLLQKTPFGTAIEDSEETDPMLASAREYFALALDESEGYREAARKHPQICAAEEIQRNSDICEQLKILALSGSPHREGAMRTGLDESIIETWESLYFDVRESREASSWVTAHIIQAEMKEGNAAFAAKLKIACFSGPAAAKTLLDTDCPKLLAPAERLLERDRKLQLKFEEAASAPFVSEKECNRFLLSFAELLLSQQRLQLAERKFEARCKQLERKAELVENRQRYSAERHQRRVEEKMRRQEVKDAAVQVKERGRQECMRLKREREFEEARFAAACMKTSPLTALKWSLSSVDRPNPEMTYDLNLDLPATFHPSVVADTVCEVLDANGNGYVKTSLREVTAA